VIEVYTRNGALALGFEQEYGSLEPGKRADLVVLDTDVMSCPDEALVDAKVLTTYFGGEALYER
jgi:predicted amidohydrolase YtcJ